MRESVAPAPPMLLVTRNFPPLLGGMEKLNQHLLRELAAAGPVALCGPAGSGAHAPASAAPVFETRLRPLAWFVLATAARAVVAARRIRARVVVAGSGLTAPPAWLAGRLSGARTAVYLHGLDLIAPSRVYQRLWLPFIRRCDLVFVNSRNTAGLAAGRGVDPGRIRILHPGVGDVREDPAAARAFRDTLGLGGRPVLLSVGRLTARKGLPEFIARSLPAIRARWPDVLLLVIGEDAVNALHGRAGSERARIGEAAVAAGLADHVRCIDHVDDATLAAAYEACDLHVFPVRSAPGDVEGFGMVALEAAAHGLPTVAFDVGGVGDAVAHDRSGWLVAEGDYAGLAAAIAALPVRDEGWRQARRAACREFASTFHWRLFGERLRAHLAALVAPPPEHHHG